MLGHAQPHLGSKVYPETMVQTLEYILTSQQKRREASTHHCLMTQAELELSTDPMSNSAVYRTLQSSI